MKYSYKLFDTFQRLHSPLDFDDCGMVLAIVQRIIFRHGVSAWAVGKVDRATFYLSLF